MNSAVILAGGKSSRMGQDKALLPFNGYNSMAEFQYRKLKQYFDNVYISSKEDKFDFDVHIIKDIHSQSSPMVALDSIFKQIRERSIFVLSVDMPNVDKAVIDALKYHYRHSHPKPDITIAENPGGREPLCGIYRETVRPHVKRLLEDGIHKLSTLLDSVFMDTVHYKDQNKFANINTPQQYRAIHP